MSDPIDEVHLSDGEEDEYQNVSVVKKRLAPQQEEKGKSSVMPETMDGAREAASNLLQFSQLTGEAVASVAAHEVNSRLNASSVPSAESISSHKQRVASAGAKGKEIGAAAATGLTPLIMAIARRMGAHQCDACHKKDLYNYYTCTNSSCMNEQQRAGLEGGYDLCEACYKTLKAGDIKAATFHPQSHASDFVLYNNSEYALKLLGIVVLALIFLKFIFGRFF